MQKEFVFSLSSDERMGEKRFLKDVLNRYDKNAITESILYADSYKHKLFWHLTFKRDATEFETWLRKNYPDKIQFTEHIPESPFNYFRRRGYNITSLYKADDVDHIIDRFPSGSFLVRSLD